MTSKDVEMRLTTELTTTTKHVIVQFRLTDVAGNVVTKLLA